MRCRSVSSRACDFNDVHAAKRVRLDTVRRETTTAYYTFTTVAEPKIDTKIGSAPCCAQLCMHVVGVDELDATRGDIGDAALDRPEALPVGTCSRSGVGLKLGPSSTLSLVCGRLDPPKRASLRPSQIPIAQEPRVVLWDRCCWLAA